MMQLTDNYGRTVTVTTEYGFDVYRVDGGLELRFEAGWPQYRALDTINAMAPEGWAPPQPSQEQLLLEIQELMSRLEGKL